MALLSPITRQKLRRFRSLKRGWWSFLLLVALTFISLFSEMIANSRALVVRSQGSWYFPTYGDIIPGKTFGLDYDYETDYRALRDKFSSENKGGWVLMPPIPWNPTETDAQEGVMHPAAPTAARRHLLGTDKTGRDVLSRLIYGYRNNMMFAMAYTLGVYLAGVVLGCLMGWLGGKVDLLGQRVVEVWQSVPFLYTVMIAVSIMPVGLSLWMRITILLLIMVFLSWMGIARYMRAATLKEKSRDYTASARLLGAGQGRIIFRHILPNTLATLVTFLPFTVAGAIASLTALDFLNFGLPPPTPSWGELLAQGMENLYAEWLVVSAFSAIAIALTLVTFTGEALREAFDPKKYTTYQ
ncbi:MAG: ABC transporter permease subunit [Verrucomicrobiaceae bacterium]|nr:MAG: ABC transporter permease subunit [Verrucomicrobiaceae bacterium]